MLLVTDSVVGMIPAAPTPIRARAAISSVALPANAAHNEPAPNEPRQQRPAPPEAVAEAAGREREDDQCLQRRAQRVGFIGFT